ncbi:MAG: PKD domain-containing protein [Spirochaetia bacterium]|nr:PKD domain-containing protein [Spirochaetia bacterium]
MSKGTVTTDENWILTLSLSSTTNLDISIKSQDTNLTDIDPDPIDLNIPPTAEIISPASDVTIDEKKTVTFAGAHSDDDVSSLIHAWDFGDGTTHSTLKDPGLVTFSTAGTFTVTYTVTDDVGQTDSAKVTVTVKEDENPTQPSTPNTPPKGLRVIGSR